jgi:hypothetical protein
MREDEDYAGNGEQNHPEAKPIQQVHSPTSICPRRFHFGNLPARTPERGPPFQRLADGPVVVRDTRPTSGRIIALTYNFSCSFATTFVAFLASLCAKVDSTSNCEVLAGMQGRSLGERVVRTTMVQIRREPGPQTRTGHDGLLLQT